MLRRLATRADLPLLHRRRGKKKKGGNRLELEVSRSRGANSIALLPSTARPISSGLWDEHSTSTSQ